MIFVSGGTDVRGDYIDFISSYCDRWCERCPFTARCSAYAVQMATAMCEGDLRAGIELAVGAPRHPNAAAALGTPPPPANAAEAKNREAFLDYLSNYEPTQAELAQVKREAAEAVDVASRDGFFIRVKLHRALDGRDRAVHGEDFEDHPIQNDWNGSAKVALISIVRSTKAWDVIARATGDPDARHIKQELTYLQRDVERHFPDAWKFMRPGFDG